MKFFYSALLVGLSSVVLCSKVALSSEFTPMLSQQQVLRTLTPYAQNSEFPSRLDFEGYGRLAVDYTLDVGLHDKIASIYESYNPDYAAFVAIEPATGKIISLTSYVKENDYAGNFALSSTGPAASLAKILSAASALDQSLVTPDTVIPFNGKSTTLYKSQILRHKDNKYTRRMPFSEAFARSSNPVFGRLGMEFLSPEIISDYADKMGFGRLIARDLPLKMSKVDHDFALPWEMAEVSSGFTKKFLLSPLHAAAIMSGILNKGQLKQPFIVDTIKDGEGNLLYKGQSDLISNMFSESTAQDLKVLMRETVEIGSARKSFAKHRKYSAYKGADFGGKTGSLSGGFPQGRYNWFAGFGERNGSQVAYASLIVYKDKWVVRPAQVAFDVLNYLFKQDGMAPVKSQQE